MSNRRVLPVALTLSALCLGAASSAAAAPQATASAAPARKLAMNVTIKKFVADRSGVRALGTATASVGGRGTQRPVTLAVSRSTKCTVLSLSLQKLQLQLLGLNLDTSAINLRITGDSDGTLGALFCRLASGLKLSSLAGARSAAASLNHRLAKRPMRALAVRASLPTAQASQAATSTTPAGSCDVLDLVLGPLNLDLLGLVVDLYGPTTTKPVEVHVTANPFGGILGSVFCKLASGQAVTTPAA